ncbi:MAG: universal stress protein, partial [Bacteroidia bacterium]|nr:universal stress protein [Bacteroidia bacterium]
MAASLDSSNEEEILYSLPSLLRGITLPGHFRLYHVITPEQLRLSPIRGESFLHQLERAREEAEKKLTTYCTLLKEKLPAGASIDYVIESQEVAAPGEEIAQYLRRENFSLLIAAFKQRKRWERFFGTTALWDIMENAPIPVLLLPAPLSIPPKRFLWVSNMQSEEFPLLKPLVHFVKTLNATLY